MWPQGYFNSTYWTTSFWEKSGAVGAVAPVTGTGTASQLLPLMGIGCWLLVMVLAGCADVPRDIPPPISAAPHCMTWPMLGPQLAQRYGLRAAPVPDVSLFLRAFNAWGEQTDFKADEIYLGHLGEEALAIFVTNGCVVATSPIPWGEAERMMLGGEGA